MNDPGEIKGLIFNIQRFSIHDGAGIRTLIFMKGCPLRCLWCCNPESQSFAPEVMFVQKKCIGCGTCAQVCPQGGVDRKTWGIDRNACDACGTCVNTCYAQSKQLVGQWKSVYEIMEQIEKDRIFFHNSRGGVTIGGGEPTSQPEFVKALLRQCKQSNLHTAMETCGWGKWETIGSMFSELDEVFFDIKHMDDSRHRILTGVSNQRILQNAERVAAMGKRITFRIPLIPGCNDEEENVMKTGAFVKGLDDGSGRIKLELLSYHPLGSDKYTWMGQDYQLKELISAGDEQKERYHLLLIEAGCNVVV